MVLSVLQRRADNASLATSCCSVLAAIFLPPSLRTVLKGSPLCDTAIAVLQAHKKDQHLVGAAMLLLSR